MALIDTTAAMPPVRAPLPAPSGMRATLPLPALP